MTPAQLAYWHEFGLSLQVREAQTRITTWQGYVMYGSVPYCILAIGWWGFSTWDLWEPETEWIV